MTTFMTQEPGFSRSLKQRPESDARRGVAEPGASTAFPAATDAALEILRAGGNAIDASVAAAWALSVCEPSASGLGGQSTLLIYHGSGVIRVIDGHSYAPAAASTGTISARQQHVGHRACTIPSTPATLAYAQRTYGVLPESRVLEPAIRIAQEGYPMTALQCRQLAWVARHLRESDAGSLFLSDGNPPHEGYIFRQPRLAQTLRLLAEEGVEDFYRGNMARSIAEDMRRHNGLITDQDLANYNLPIERRPLAIRYRGFRVVTVPPPGGGLQLLLGLKILEQLSHLKDLEDPTKWYESVALSTYAAFRDREQAPVGPNDLTPSLLEYFFDERRIRQLANEIAKGPLVGGNRCGKEGPGDTTHLTVADCTGNVVSLTQSIQSVFGAKVAHPELGFIYNNYLCSCLREPHPYGLAGYCLPRSNAAPALVLRQSVHGSVPVLALGAAGSRRITSSILQVISSVLDRGMDVDEAVAAPRVHARLSRKVWIERPAAQPHVIAGLQKHFREIQLKSARSYKLGAVHALQWLDDGRVIAAADPRRDGAARVGA